MQIPFHVFEKVLHVLEVHEHAFLRPLYGTMQIRRLLRQMKGLDKEETVALVHEAPGKWDRRGQSGVAPVSFMILAQNAVWFLRNAANSSRDLLVTISAPPACSRLTTSGSLIIFMSTP